MNTTALPYWPKPMMITTFLAVGGLLCLVGFHERVPAQEPAKGGTKWEYCSLLGGENALVFFTPNWRSEPKAGEKWPNS